MYYTEEERKMPLEHYVDGLTFKSCVDLSSGIVIEKSEWMKTVTQEEIVKQTMVFTAWWVFNIHPKLNGFSGLDTVPIKCNF